MAQYYAYIFVLYFIGLQYCLGLPSSSDITDIVGLHNQYRASKCVKNLKWDSSIASIAQSYSDKCKYAHSGIVDYGENIAYGEDASVQRLVQLWASEARDYACGDPNGIYNAGHYTQIMWNTTTLVGCGFTSCSFGNYLVCNYKTPGNTQDRAPHSCPDQCNNGSPLSVPESSSGTSGQGTNGKALTTAPITTSPLTADYSVDSNGEENIENQNHAVDGNEDRLMGLSKPAAIGVIVAVVVATLGLASILVTLIVLKKRRNSHHVENNLIISPPGPEMLPVLPEQVQPTIPSAPSSPSRTVAEVLVLPPNSPKLLGPTEPTAFTGSPCAPRYYAKSHAQNTLATSPVISRFAVGTVCQAMWTGDSQYYRARIDDIQGHNYLVTFVDFGDSQEWVPKICLRMMRS